MPKERANSALAFDVYGTLVDPFRMEEHLGAIFGENARAASELWRNKQIEYSFRRALMKKYQNFDACTAQALDYVCAHFGISAPRVTLCDLSDRYLELPTYADVPGALAELEGLGFKLVACSNGTETAVRGLLKKAGVLPRFSDVVSVDSLHTFKPDPAVYEYLVGQVQTKKKNVWMISSNPFDVIGAKACGLRTVWVRRDAKKVFDPWEFEPDIVVTGLGELAGKLNFI